jgi:hypothetical protein
MVPTKIEGVKIITWKCDGLCGLEGFLARDHHSCVSAPSETTRVSFYIYSMPQELPKRPLLILEFHMPSSPWCHADEATTSLRPVQQYAWHHWGTMALMQPRKSVHHICCIWFFFIPRLDRQPPQVIFCFFCKIIYIASVIVHAVG